MGRAVRTLDRLNMEKNVGHVPFALLGGLRSLGSRQEASIQAIWMLVCVCLSEDIIDFYKIMPDDLGRAC
jgi:hypothetical protein